MGDDGAWGQWRQGVLAIRALAHIGVAAESAHGASPRARVAMLTWSLASDTWIALRRRRSHRRRVVEVVINMIDVAGWSWLVRDDPIHLQSLTLATLAPNLMETGFRLGAGTSTVPVIEPASEPCAPWSIRGIGRLALDAAPVLVTMVVVRRWRGLAVGNTPVVWGVLGALGGYGLARTRARAQASTARRWEERTAYLVEEARIRSRVQSALVHNTTRVEPKAMLALLERAGSPGARDALEELTSTPAAAVAAAKDRGITLSAAVDLRSVHPAAQRTRWVPRSQVRDLRDAIADADSRLGPVDPDAPGSDHVEVLASGPRSLVVSYRGEPIETAQPAPDLAIRLEPTLWFVAASSVLALVSQLTAPDRASTPASLGAFTLQALAIWRLLGTDPQDRRGDRMTAVLLAVSSLVLDTSIARGSHRAASRSDTEPLETCAGTSATQPVMLLLGSSWHDLRAEAPTMLAGGITGWIASLRLWRGRSWHSTIGEAAFLFTPLLATLGLGARIDREAHLLDEALQQRLSETIESQARIEAEHEIGRLLGQLDTVIDELPALHPGLTDAEANDVVASYRSERARIAAADPLELIGW